MVEVLLAASVKKDNVVGKVPILTVVVSVCIGFDVWAGDLVEVVNPFVFKIDCIFVVAATELSAVL